MINPSIVQKLEGVKQDYFESMPSVILEYHEKLKEIKRTYFSYILFTSKVAKQRGIPQSEVNSAIEKISIFKKSDDEDTKREKLENHLKTLAYMMQTDFPELEWNDEFGFTDTRRHIFK